MTKTPNMKRWSEDKLAKELYFANACKDESHPETMEWLTACVAEAQRRLPPKAA